MRAKEAGRAGGGDWSCTRTCKILLFGRGGGRGKPREYPSATEIDRRSKTLGEIQRP